MIWSTATAMEGDSHMRRIEMLNNLREHVPDLSLLIEIVLSMSKGEFEEIYNHVRRIWKIQDIEDRPRTYRITRFFKVTSTNRTIKTGLTLEEAKEHCRDLETSSRTCKKNTEGGEWFDGYEEEEKDEE